MAQDDGSTEQRRGNEDSGWLEWTASGTGLILAVGGIAYILWIGVTAADRPPEVQVEARRIVERQPGYTVEIAARNMSGNTAAGVVVEGELRRGGQTVETSETTFDYVPGRSERQGGLYFTQDPRQFELELRPRGYVKP